MRLMFTYEKETPGTVRYKEVTDDPGYMPAVGTLYVKKAVLAEFSATGEAGYPEVLTVTIEAG
jgi:hypothetical protein